MIIPEELKFSVEELGEIREKSGEVKVSDNIRKAIKDIRTEYNRTFYDEKSEIISDRKLVKIMKLIRISAYINGRNGVDFSDLLLLSDCLWNDVKNVEKVAKIVLDTVRRNITRQN